MFLHANLYVPPWLNASKTREYQGLQSFSTLKELL